MSYEKGAQYEEYYDKEVDAAYIRLSDAERTGVIEISEGIKINLTDKEEIVGIDIGCFKEVPFKIFIRL